MKRVASPGSMHDTGCLGLVHWDDPEGWYGEGGGRRVQDREHVYTCGGFMLIIWQNQYNIVKLKKKITLSYLEKKTNSMCSIPENDNILDHQFKKLTVCAKLLRSCSTLCSPMDCSLPGSSVHEIFQARILEWIAIPFSRGSSPCRNRTCVSYVIGRRVLYH